jgi:hypothetical protein
VAGGGVGAEGHVGVRLAEELLGLRDGQLVRGHVLRHVDPLPVALQVGAVAADPDHDVGIGQRERADVPGVDVADVADQRLKSLITVGTEVEPAQPRHPLGLAAGDAVQGVFHPGGELVVDQLAEVPLEQRDHREGQERGHQRGALLEHVAAVQDGADDAGVRRGPADLPVLQLLDQRGLGVAGRRAGGVLGRGQPQHVERVGLGQRRQPALPVVAVAGVVGVLDVGLEESVEVDDLAGRAELGPLVRGRGARDPDRDRLAGGVLHLRGDGALPDQLVQPALVRGQTVPGHLGRGAEAVAGRADGLVRLLGVLDLAGVDARGVRDVIASVQLGGLLAGRGDRGLGERHRVGAHIGDVAVLVQSLRHRHGVLGREAQLA